MLGITSDKTQAKATQWILHHAIKAANFGSWWTTKGSKFQKLESSTEKALSLVLESTFPGTVNKNILQLIFN